MTATHQNTTAGTPAGEFPFFRTLETTCNRISNPVLEVAKEAARTSCLHQVSLIEKKPIWNVSDAATGEFVKAFYSNLATSQDVKASFHYAQDQLKSQYPHPYYWAAFYLSQAN